MKFLSLILIVFGAAAVFGATEDEDQAWNDFKVQHSKLFLSKNKEAGRKETFLQNRAKVSDLQQQKEAGNLKYTPKIYENADLSREEFLTRYGGFDHAELEAPVARAKASTVRQSLPMLFDSRDFGWIGPVRTQGNCRSCWAFSALSCVEAGLAIKHNPDCDLAEQQLVDCAQRGGDGCAGGRMDDAFDYLKETGGAVEEDEYPYTGIFGTCRIPQGTIPVGDQFIPSPDDESIKLEIMWQGSLAIAVDCGPWQFYGGGIFHGDEGNPPNHAANLIGWGSEDGEDYWIVRNSWGTDFGEDGYIRLCASPDGGYDFKYTWAIKK